MKALSIMQPWAHYILRYGKDIENRSWPTSFRGVFLIHAGKRWDGEPYEGIIEGERDAPDLPATDFVRGAILGVSEITDCVQGHKSIWVECGQWNFVLSNSYPFKKPIPYKGQLGFFDVPDELVAEEIARCLRTTTTQR